MRWASIDFTGDMPIILGPDGPSLGGFVCPAVVARDELWKIGQLKPGDKVRFAPLSREQMIPLTGSRSSRAGAPLGSAIVGRSDDGPVPVVYRRAGDDNLLVEYGPMELDIALRLARACADASGRGMRESAGRLIDLTPGIRSLQIHYDSTVLSRRRLLEAVARTRAQSAAGRCDEGARAASCICRCRGTTRRPCWRCGNIRNWCGPTRPGVRRTSSSSGASTGSISEDEVKRIVFDAAISCWDWAMSISARRSRRPIDPRHRLVTTKYNPARTWTPENAVGIGGAYMCIYGMEGPGGYQLFGRTIQMWNTWRTTPEFAPGHPWLLRFFDQIRFFPGQRRRTAGGARGVSARRLSGEDRRLRVFLRRLRRRLARDRDSIAAFKRGQQAAFDAERQRWAELRIDEVPDEVAASAAVVDDIPDGHSGVFSEVPGNVWKIFGDVGADVAAGDVVAIIELMKMEIRVLAPVAGRLSSVRVKPGQTLRAGDVVALIKEG